MSGTICKEQCTKCKCIVKERILNKKKQKSQKMQEIDETEQEQDCTELYKNLGNCLHQCLMEKMNKRSD
ncbi:hypothetical protein PGB90_009213 [Kerria lacca]